MLRKVLFGLMCLLVLSALGVQAQSRITASTMDSDGNVYVTGWSAAFPGMGIYQYEAATIKYDRNGNVLWSHAYPADPAKWECEGYAIAVDPEGNVYVAGYILGERGLGAPTNYDVECLLIKYPHNYTQGQDPEWVRTYDGGVYHDQYWNMAIDSDGDIYVTGYSAQINDGVQSNDLLTMKYDSMGNVVWTHLYNGPANGGESAYAITVDPANKNVYVTGTARVDLSSPTAFDMITIMYNEQGVVQWVQQYSGPGNALERGTSLALDAVGNVYVTGHSLGETSSYDYATIKYDVGGNEVWVARYDGPAEGNDQPAPPIASGFAGSFGNYISNNQGIIVTEELLDPVPALEYLKGQVMGLAVNRGLKISLSVKLDACLNSLLAVNADLRKNAHHVLGAFINHCWALAAAGVLSEEDACWLTDIAEHIIQGILGIETAVVYVTGQSQSAGGTTINQVDFATVKYNAATGRPMWRLPGQPGTTPDQPGNPSNIALRYDGPESGPFSIDRAWGMAIDQAGHIYVTGPSTEAFATQSVDFFTIKYLVNTYEPRPLAEARYNGPANMADQSCGFATWRDPASGRYYIFRDPATGEDYVCVTGNSVTIGTSRSYNEYAAVMYNGSLVLQWIDRWR